MINTISVQTSIGFVDFEAMHKNGALQVAKAPTQDPELFFYNTVHNNGLKLPATDTRSLTDAIAICDWCVENFPEFAANTVNMPKAKQKEFSDRLYDFRFVKLKDWEDDND